MDIIFGAVSAEARQAYINKTEEGKALQLLSRILAEEGFLAMDKGERKRSSTRSEHSGSVEAKV